MTGASPWWARSLHSDRRGLLLTRNRIRSAARQYFEEQGFVEFEAACLQVSPGNEAHLNAFKTELVGTDLERSAFYLHTSPEFAAKKLLAAGEVRLFTFAHAFRNRERGPLHHPEFTMLEWYRASETYDRAMEDCLTLLRLAAATAENRFFSYLGRTCDTKAAAERLTVSEAFNRHTGIDVLALAGDRKGLAAAATATGLRVSPDDGWSDLFSRLLAAFVEPKLGIGRPTLLMEYPLEEAALARPSARDPRVAERFELYICGVEIANGFGELTDPAEQRRRFVAEMDARERTYGERYPIDEDFMAALAHMPEASGVALGFDRLVMLATGASRIDQVIWTPVPYSGQ